ncbi:hypothetical protein GCM10027535_25590 [Mycolicibacterium hippocampi]|uniref:Uncharacterized protein n=1 Tax=Mycolicibacterium hippocampi TaxID=659824 RepID=A0A7I9ZS22_9MYCO|nr:hypothetical protein MHIP_41420 [Mycolicibacterium hippocampi]
MRATFWSPGSVGSDSLAITSINADAGGSGGPPGAGAAGGGIPTDGAGEVSTVGDAAGGADGLHPLSPSAATIVAALQTATVRRTCVTNR